MHWINMALVHMYIELCAQPCGAPLTGSICNARIRAPMKSTAIIGAKNMVQIAPSSAPVSFEELIPENDWNVLPNWMPAYTMKYIDVRIMVHATAGDTGGMTSPGQEPAGGSKVYVPK